jgi:hypothetical protein
MRRQQPEVADLLRLVLRLAMSPRLFAYSQSEFRRPTSSCEAQAARTKSACDEQCPLIVSAALEGSGEKTHDRMPYLPPQKASSDI